MQYFKDWTASQWLSHLENRHHDVIKLGLNRIKQVASKLNLLKPNAVVITVAGTNGKGTTVAALSAIYRAAGYRVGAYTSPHLLAFNERISVNGELIADEALCNAFAQIETTRSATHLTYFETTTLAALLYFQQCQVDVMILEVGMGGRLDATNLISPLLSIITTIDYDHHEYLGNTLDSIGFEKAGILRKETPFIYADTTAPTSISHCALLLHCPSYYNGHQYQIQASDSGYQFVCGEKELNFPPLSWHPNAIGAALMATLCLQDKLPVADAARLQGVLSITLEGRQQYRTSKDGVKVLFDVSHNAQSASYLAHKLADSASNQRVHAVFAALGDKDLDALVHPLLEKVDYWYPAQLSGKRATQPEALHFLFNKYDIMVEDLYNSPLQAYQAACQKACLDDLIVVYGSFVTVGEVLAALNKEFSRSEYESSHRGKSET